ncbi:hypothetical protein RchiOBHm_Chr2g0134681 [Rosa chinensis]|uniref:Uncharacterized protein n=1 Tax=Rosa chinensis TaxID=74649 RepID=A0A2P6RVW8_ROSCH|nr:hypothetical protein RchiOBHm_Chr2g0134681 [Rosa chinensis]
MNNEEMLKMSVFTFIDSHYALKGSSLHLFSSTEIQTSRSGSLPEDLARTGAYSDLFVFITDDEADICFYSSASDLLSTIRSRRPRNEPRHQEKRSRDCAEEAEFRRAETLAGCHRLHRQARLLC